MSDPNLTPGEAARFPSFLTLREAHDALLEREEEDTPETRAAILDFVTRGQATGAVLDAESDRRAAQSLLSYWTTRLYRVGVKLTKVGLVEFDPTLAPELPDEPRPYRGLDAFLEDDQGLFFGRESLIADLVRRLENGRLLAVLGASGSGKSSVVRAGLIPALKNGAVPGSEHWRYARPMVPGSNPVAALEHALQSLPAEADPPRPLVLVVDQFEEVFTLSDKAEREAFVGRVLDLLHDPSIPHRVILTMRTDFYDRIATFSEFKSEFENAVERVRPLSAAELRRAIEEPANKVGLKFEEGVVTSLLEDILGEPAALPLLQFTLLQLWEKRQRNRVTRAVYRELGGGHLALQTVADQFFNEKLLPEEQEVARRIFLKLVRPSEGLEVTSQRLRRSELFAKAYNAEITERVLNKLVSDARLLRQTEGDTPADTQIEVAHEALVRNWPTLMGWLEDERENVRRRNRLRDQAKRWLAANRDPNLLWRGRDLEEAEQLGDLSAEEADFVHASRGALEREVAEKEAARQRELEAAAARQLAETERRAAQSARRLTRIIGAIGVVALVAAVLAGFFGIQSSLNANQAQAANTQSSANLDRAEAAGTQANINLLTAQAASTLAVNEATNSAISAATAEAAASELAAAATELAAAQALAESAQATAVVARDELKKARSLQLAAQALNALNSQHNLGLLLGIEAYRTFNTEEATNVLLIGLQSNITQTTELVDRRASQNGAIYSVAFSPDGQMLAWGSSDGSVTIWNLGTHLQQQLGSHAGKAYTVAFSPDGKILASGGQDGIVILWDVATGQVSTSFRRTTSAWVLSLAFSPDGKTVAVGHTGSTIDLWDVTAISTPRFLRNLAGGHRDDVWSVAWSRDSRLASGSADGTVRVWDPETGSLVLTPERLHTDIVWSVAWSSDGKLLASGSRDNTIILWDASTGQPTGQPLTGHTQQVLSVAFSPDGRILASGSADNTTILWDITSHALIAQLKGHTNAVKSVIFSPIENILASGSFDQTIVLQRIIPPQSGSEPLDTRACALAGRNFTQDEWVQFFPGQDYHRTCDQWPDGT